MTWKEMYECRDGKITDLNLCGVKWVTGDSSSPSGPSTSGTPSSALKPSDGQREARSRAWHLRRQR